MWAPASATRRWPSSAAAKLTAGLKCAPEIGANARIKATSAAPVAMVLARSAVATFPPASRSAMIQEPTTAATRKPVPANSAVARRARERGEGMVSASLRDRCRARMGFGMLVSRRILSLSYVVDIFLDGELIQTGERQAKKQTDAAIQGDESIAKCLADLLL